MIGFNSLPRSGEVIDDIFYLRSSSGKLDLEIHQEAVAVFSRVKLTDLLHLRRNLLDLLL